MKAASVDAAEWYTAPDLTVTYSKPGLSWERVTRILRSWLKRQGRAWPSRVTVDTLVDGMDCVFVPYLLASAWVSFSWSGKRNIPTTRSVNCSYCHGTGRRSEVLSGNVHSSTSCHHCSGSGRETETYYRTKTVSGSFKSILVDPHLHDADGLGQANFVLKCDEPNIWAAITQRIPLKDAGKVAVIGATWKDGRDVAEAGSKLIESALYEKVEHDEVGVYDVKLNDVKYRTRTYTIHLYPLFVNSYEYGRGTYGIQVDGHSGHVWVAAPFSVRTKRLLWRIAEAVFWFLAIVLGASYLALVFWFLTGRMP